METALKILEWMAGLAALGWFCWWRLQRSQSSRRAIVTKSLITGVLVFAMVRHVAPLALSGIGAIVGVPLLAAMLVILAILWRHEITGIFADPLGDMIDGGKEQIEPQPHYAHVEAKRMAGDYAGAVTAVRAELEKFPHDFDGHMRLAALLAEHLKDLPGALGVIEDTLQLPALAPNQIAYRSTPPPTGICSSPATPSPRGWPSNASPRCSPAPRPRCTRSSGSPTSPRRRCLRARMNASPSPCRSSNASWA